MKMSLPSATASFIAVLLSFYSLTVTAQTKNDLARFNLTGSVKKIVQAQYLPGANNNLVGFSRGYDFDEKGMLTAEYIGHKEKIRKVKSYLYDNNEYLVNADSTQQPGFTITQKTDEKGNVIERSYKTSAENFNRTTKYKYDSKGNMIEEWSPSANGLWYMSRSYKYDDNGNKLVENVHKVDGSFYINNSWLYDEKGNVIERSSFKTTGGLFYRYNYKYDEKGNVIEWTDHNADGVLAQQGFSEYEFDKTGNWIKKISRSEKEASKDKQSVEQRIIEYY